MKRADSQLSYQEAVFALEEEDIADLPVPEKGNFETAGIIGQPRAMKSLLMGTEITASGYNIFVSGPPGTGRHTAVRRILESKIDPLWPRKDIALVYNFTKPENSRVLFFSPGRAGCFKSDLHGIVENLKKSIPASLESGSHIDRRDRLVEVIEGEENRLLREFEKRIADEGFHLLYVDEESGGVMEIVPEYEGKPASFDVLQGKLLSGEINEQEWNRVREGYHLFMDELKTLYRELRDARDNLEEELEALRLESVMPVISAEVSLLKDRYPEAAAEGYLDDLQDDLAANLYLFTLDRQLFDEGGNPRFIRYGVNILEDGSEGPAVPVVWENNPTPANLLGGTDTRVDPSSENRTSFLRIRPGSLVKASGGFLLLPAEELLRNGEGRRLLRGFLQTGSVEISAPRMKPNPIPIDVRVIVIGTAELYDSLLREDPNFEKYFKIRAVFTVSMPRTPETTAGYVSFIRRKVKESAVSKIDDSGICALIEYGVRLAGDRSRLSAGLSRIADCIIEAGYRARAGNKDRIDRETIRETLEEKLTGGIDAEKVPFPLSGSQVGRVMGIALYKEGPRSFPVPESVSAVAAPQRPGEVTIKGGGGAVGEIIEGYLRNRYAADFPLSLYAGISRGQSRRNKAGCVTPAADICALLSALSGIPVKQNIAVLGGFSHTGEVLPIEGITEIIEGYYRICRGTGFRGEPGIILPKRNMDNLLLGREIGEAVREQNLVLFAVSTVEEACAILTGAESKEIDKKISRYLETLITPIYERKK